jgi:HK97 family phage portal protein
MLKQIQGLLRKALGLPSTWSDRTWARVLRGDWSDGSLTTDMLLRSSAVVACASLIADSLGSCPLRCVIHSPGGGTQVVTQSDAVTSLLSFTFDDRTASVFGAAALGNGWCYRNPDTAELLALDSWRTTAYVDPDQKIWVREGGGELLPYESIGHIKFRSQPRYVLGFNPCMLASDSVLASLGVLRMARAMSVNNARPGIILSMPTSLSDKALKNVKDSWKEAFGGDSQGSSPAVLEEGLQASVLPMPDAASSQLVESLEFGSADIARIYGVPPSTIGLVKDSSRSTSVEESRQLVQRCLKPWGSRIGDRLSRLLLTDQERAKGLVIEHDLSELVLGLGKERSEYLSRLVLSGILRSNEARGSIGAEPDPDGNKLRFPVNVMPDGGNDGGSPQAQQ